MTIDDHLYKAALKLLQSRYQNGQLAGATAMYTEDGDILTSTYPYGEGVHQRLCYETGAICEAHKNNKRIVASICLLRKTNSDQVLVIAPCGVCQERLFYWGGNVQVAIPDPKDPTHYIVKTLSEVQPHYLASALYQAKK